MNHDRDVAAIVKKLKQMARARPWVPMGAPPREHYHKFPNGLTLCFTLDILRGVRYWHLSIGRVNGRLAPEEIEFWPRAFFDEEPTIELLSQILGLSSKHFHWRAE